MYIHVCTEYLCSLVHVDAYNYVAFPSQHVALAQVS